MVDKKKQNRLKIISLAKELAGYIDLENVDVVVINLS